MFNPLVSIIVTTKNSGRTIEACLRSIQEQTYQQKECLVVDNFSTDQTKQISQRFADQFFEQGPERSTQRNFGVAHAKGELVVIIDSDMVLSKEVIQQCVSCFAKDSSIRGVIIPEESFGVGFWAHCKKLERSFYLGVDWMESARCFRKQDFVDVGGYNEELVSGEDWDLSQRIESLGPFQRTEAFIFHDEGRLRLFSTIKKKFFYAQLFSNYLKQSKSDKISQQTSVWMRYRLYFSKPRLLLRNPILFAGMLFMKSCELGVGALGYLLCKNKQTS